MIQKKAFAKINIALDILCARPDGMHEVDLVLTPLKLHDTLTFELLAETTDIQLEAPYGLGPREDNLVFRAAKLLQQHFAVDKGVRITLDKQIPVAAGLAGGSSDAAATLQGLVELWQIVPKEDELHTLATILGADVPYCLYHTTMRGQGVGEKLAPIPSMMPVTVVLFKPKEYGISASDAYRYIDEAGAFTQGHVESVIDALKMSDYNLLSRRLYNGFEPVLFELFPDLAIHRTAIRELADGALISGSGPTIFAFTHTAEQTKALMTYGARHGLETIQTETK